MRLVREPTEAVDEAVVADEAEAVSAVVEAVAADEAVVADEEAVMAVAVAADVATDNQYCQDISYALMLIWQ